jgi:hypothetical protein
MADRLTDQERAAIDAAVAEGRVKHVPRGASAYEAVYMDGQINWFCGGRAMARRADLRQKIEARRKAIEDAPPVHDAPTKPVRKRNAPPKPKRPRKMTKGEIASAERAAAAAAKRAALIEKAKLLRLAGCSYPYIASKIGVSVMTTWKYVNGRRGGEKGRA